jgi:hypothetical protein
MIATNDAKHFASVRFFIAACGILGCDITGLAGAGPLFEQTDVFESGRDGYIAYRIPAIETTPDGSLRSLKGANTDSRIRVSTSRKLIWSSSAARTQDAPGRP